MSLYGLEGLQDWDKAPKFLGVYKYRERYKHIFLITRALVEKSKKPHSLFFVFFEYKEVDEVVFIRIKGEIVEEMLKQYTAYKQCK